MKIHLLYERQGSSKKIFAALTSEEQAEALTTHGNSGRNGEPYKIDKIEVGCLDFVRKSRDFDGFRSPTGTGLSLGQEVIFSQQKKSRKKGTTK